MATLQGREIDSGEERTIEVPVDFYEAAIGVDAIIGYEWLAAYEFWINAGRNSITRQFPDTGNNVSISGNREKRLEIAMATRIETPIILPYEPHRQAVGPAETSPILRTPRIFRMLDLFAGTGSVGAYFRRLGYEVVSVDSNPKWEPDIIADIGNWECWRFFQRGEFDVVGCCPPCTEYSRAMTTRARDFPSADRLVKAALGIIDYLQPQFWFLENPAKGELRNRDFMQGIPSIEVDYCMFSDWGYRKPTRIWGDERMVRIGNRTCDGWCRNMEYNTDGNWVHRKALGCTPPGRPD
jgi:hypothetical protein